MRAMTLLKSTLPNCLTVFLMEGECEMTNLLVQEFFQAMQFSNRVFFMSHTPWKSIYTLWLPAWQIIPCLKQARMWHDNNTQSMHHKYKCSQHSSIIWKVWLTGCVFIYKLCGCGFESRCNHLIFRYAPVSRSSLAFRQLECRFTLMAYVTE